ncbi:PBSX family phage terminase large subunit [Loigolactobacillus bifermentans]|uniref:PBSX family phage terminase n=1 Tax=Loigolactobacillus bifermentans DSM 20003 TaxID=1423726 RepID=A0A0R1GUE5_9LACO|nr:PBSX family phage terminase large subunit [Loigolactobacillus bifermentans]KRK34391.1 PBSX family phage terminase [Loigolactobacillus bifermentans DSM 20003]QGG60095.1 PBSX family phage terminase large subunit [Loigolactobacillus bifermentans]
MKTNLKEVEYSPKQASFLASPFDHLFDVNEGAIRSGKTAADDARLAMFYMLSPDENHLVSAYNQALAYTLFIEGDGLGLAYIFDGCCELRRDRGGDHLAIDLPSGHKRIYFKGGGKSNSANAIRGMSLGSVAYSEIDLMNKEFIDESFRRTIKAKYRYHLADLNPPAPNHPVIDLFDDYKAHWLHWDMRDNPTMTEQRLTEVEAELKANPYRYKRDWLGLRVMPEGAIYVMFDHETMIDATLHGQIVEMYFAGDAGQNDATTLSCNIITNVRDENGQMGYRLNRVANFYHSGSATQEARAMSTYAVELRRFILWCERQYQVHHSTVIIDPAAKSLRAELEKIGIMTETANNNAHEHLRSTQGIEVGIERCQNVIEQGMFRLVETPDSGIPDLSYDHRNFLKELGMYVRDPQSKKPVDAFNHAMDEFRYSVNYFYANYLTYVNW